jgi:pectate lyase
MMKIRLISAALVVCALSTTSRAQYPTVPHDIQGEADRAKAEADKRSDEAWEKALPVIKEWEAKGKPYIPWASSPGDLPQANIPAFPGAEGGGAFTCGGRGGKVFVVTNLEDSGPGSFREACEVGGPRIVVFNVAGIIRLKSHIRVRAPYITISGATAPGDGVCIAGDTVELETHDVIVRYLRFRRANMNVGDRDDSLGGNPIGNVIIDHVSASWGSDENLSMYRHMYGGERTSLGSGTRPTHVGALKLPTVNLTIQWCISSEALDTWHHAFGSTIGGYNSTFHHILWACNTGRNPSVGMNGDFAMANCVVFNWRHRTVDGGDDLSYFNIINNYFKPGPITPKDQPIANRILKPESSRDKRKPNAFGKAYVNGNVVEGNDEVTKDNWAGGVQLGDAGDKGTSLPHEQVLKSIRVDQPMPMSKVTIQSAEDAYESVLKDAGATRPKRDPVDQRIIEEVRTGKVTYEEGKGIITDINQVGGYPEYKGTPYVDSDGDGMPDEWETAHGLNAKDPSDASGVTSNGYTNIEEFINGK